MGGRQVKTCSVNIAFHIWVVLKVGDMGRDTFSGVVDTGNYQRIDENRATQNMARCSLFSQSVEILRLGLRVAVLSQRLACSEEVLPIDTFTPDSRNKES